MARPPVPLPTRLPRTKREWAIAVVLVLVAVAFWWWQQRSQVPAPEQPDARPSAQVTLPGSAASAGATATSAAKPTRSSSTSCPRGEGRDPESGLPVVEEAELPVEADETLDLIDDGGPFPHDRDGITFGNYEGILPTHERGYYREYTVETPGVDHRGARRIVTGDEDEFFLTCDHYGSFARIDR